MIVTDKMVMAAIEAFPEYRMTEFAGTLTVEILPKKHHDLTREIPVDACVVFHRFSSKDDADGFIRNHRMRAALEAVAPLIRNVALEDAANKAHEMWDEGQPAVLISPAIRELARNYAAQ